MNPSFGSGPNGCRQIGLAKLNGGENLVLKGASPTEKCDLTDDTTLIHLVDMPDGGTALIEDVIVKGSAWNAHAVVMAGTSDHEATLTMNRCLLASANNANIGNRDHNDGAGSAAATVTLNNCMVTFGESPLFDFSQASPTALTFTHCTAFDADAATNDALLTADAGDSVTVNYSIIDMSNDGDLPGNVAASGTTNIVNYPGSADLASALPGDTLFADPLLDASGHLTDGSPVVEAASGSTATMDYDGDSRPIPAGTDSDIGADETALSSEDTTPPVISLNGPATITLMAGMEFVDPVTASDETDGDLTASLVITGDVYPPDTSTAHTYVYFYDVSDAAGNAAETVTLTIEVLSSESTLPAAGALTLLVLALALALVGLARHREAN